LAISVFFADSEELTGPITVAFGTIVWASWGGCMLVIMPYDTAGAINRVGTAIHRATWQTIGEIVDVSADIRQIRGRPAASVVVPNLRLDFDVAHVRVARSGFGFGVFAGKPGHENRAKDAQ